MTPIGDSSKPRAWSKYAPDSSKGKINNKDSTEITENIPLNKQTVDEKKDRNKKGKKEGINKEIKEALEKVDI